MGRSKSVSLPKSIFLLWPLISHFVILSQPLPLMPNPKTLTMIWASRIWYFYLLHINRFFSLPHLIYLTWLILWKCFEILQILFMVNVHWKFDGIIFQRCHITLFLDPLHQYHILSLFRLTPLPLGELHTFWIAPNISLSLH